jgi:copper transport protein
LKGPAWSGRPRFRYCAGFGVVLLLVACWSAVHPTAARAHAEQSRSSPEAGAALATPPTHVDVWFTERLTSGVSSIQVFDVQRRRVDTGASVIDPNDPAHMGVGLQPLPAGLYTVIWSNISADDGHPNKGGFAFTVLEQPAATPIAQQGVTGQATPASSPTPGFSVSTAPAATPLPLPSQSDQAIGQLLTPASDRATATVDLVFGWLAFMALILAGGGALFALCCVLPALRRAGDEGTGATLRLLRWFGPVVLVCAAIGGVAAFGSLLAKVEIATALPARDLFSGVVLGAMLAPWSGHIWLAQEVATLAMAPVVLVSWLATRRGDASRRAVVDRASLVILVMLAVAGLICHALDSHIGAGHVARSLPLAVAALAAHFLAVGLWAGGLGFAPLLWIVWRRAGPPLRRIIVTGVIARFSTLALPSVVVIAGTGAYLAVALVPAPSDLVSSAYGQALIVKTLLLS